MQGHWGRRRASAAERLLQVGLAHLGVAADAAFSSLVPKLIARAAARALVRPEAAPAARRDVPQRGPAGFGGLARPRPFLVDGSGRYLLGSVLAPPTLEQAVFDVLVLALPLGAPSTLWHGNPPITLNDRKTVWAGAPERRTRAACGFSPRTPGKTRTGAPRRRGTRGPATPTPPPP